MNKDQTRDIIIDVATRVIANDFKTGVYKLGDLPLYVNSENLGMLAFAAECGKSPITKSVEDLFKPAQGSKYFYIDSGIKGLNLNVRLMATLIAHEYAHYSLGHLDLPLSVIMSQRNDPNSALEFEADAYAGELFGVTNTLSLLTTLKDTVTLILDDPEKFNVSDEQLEETKSAHTCLVSRIGKLLSLQLHWWPQP